MGQWLAFCRIATLRLRPTPPAQSTSGPENNRLRTIGQS